jgi:hypothetical protein
MPYKVCRFCGSEIEGPALFVPFAGRLANGQIFEDMG